MPSFLVAASLAAALLQGGSGQACEPCELAIRFVEHGDTAQARDVVLRYLEEEFRSTRERAQLLYLLVTLTPDPMRILIPDASQDTVGAGVHTRELLEGFFGETTDLGDAGWAAFAVLAHRRGQLREGEFPRAARLARRLADARPLRPPGVAGDTLAELMAVRARQLRLQIMDESRGLTARAPPARYEPCVYGGDPRQCWIEARPYDLQFLSDSPSRTEMPRALVVQRRGLFQGAFELAPGLPSVARPFLGALARAGEWRRFHRVARAHADATGETGWSLAYLATVYWRGGLVESADSLFDLAVERMPQAEREVLLDVSSSVTEENEERFLRGEPAEVEAWSEFLLRVSDPLFLTPINERRLEHLARVTLSELWYAQPDPPLRGSRTEMGRIQIRYGEPLYQWKVGPPDPGSSAADTLVSVGVTRIRVPHSGDLEWVFWHYGPNRPSFLFWRRTGTWPVHHSEKSRLAALDLRSVEPSTFDFPVSCLPHQRARFLGEDSDLAVEFYAVIPGDTASTERIPLDAALFFLPRHRGDSLISMPTRTRRTYEDQRLVFRAPLNAGDYVYALEVLSEDWALRMRDRRRLELTPFPPDGLALSDIVLARSVEARRASPRGIRDFRLEPAADLSFRQDEPLHLYFEIYPGRPPNPGGSDYRFSVRIRDLRDRSFFSRALRTLGSLFGSAEGEGTVRWTRHAALEGDRIPEWFRLEAEWEEPGLYELVLEVSASNGEESATVSRVFRVLPDGPSALADADVCGPGAPR